MTYMTGDLIEVPLTPTFQYCLRPILDALFDAATALELFLGVLTGLMGLQFLALKVLQSIHSTATATASSCSMKHKEETKRASVMPFPSSFPAHVNHHHHPAASTSVTSSSTWSIMMSLNYVTSFVHLVLGLIVICVGGFLIHGATFATSNMKSTQQARSAHVEIPYLNATTIKKHDTEIMPAETSPTCTWAFAIVLGVALLIYGMALLFVSVLGCMRCSSFFNFNQRIRVWRAKSLFVVIVMSLVTLVLLTILQRDLHTVCI